VSALTVEVADEVTPELIEAFARLVPQLSTSSEPPGMEELAEMVGAPGTSVLVARLASDGETRGDIVGTLTLVVFRIPTGIRSWIEDVVVDDAARGRGAGEALTMHAVDIAREAGAKTVDLTSRPSREAANRLYQRLGFTLRETNVYRYEIT
jgi:ribosomal protein S18 acetylase RimI-like enzyme